MLLFPNAKINLGLQVISRREDGYHNIQSIFYPIFLSDVLEIFISEEEDTNLTDIGKPSNIPIQENICYKAWKILKADYNIPAVNIYLYKNIPAGAGLGGGSSDGVFTIKAINELCELQLSEKQMHYYSKKLGSDCPFFINNRPSAISGTGDIIEPVTLDLSAYYILLIYPNIHISTPEAYKIVTPKKSNIDLAECICNSPINTWKNKVHNDFEDQLFIKHPELLKIKDKLYANGALYASMSGSGSSTYGIFKEIPSPQILALFKEYFIWFGPLK